MHRPAAIALWAFLCALSVPAAVHAQVWGETRLSGLTATFHSAAPQRALAADLDGNGLIDAIGLGSNGFVTVALAQCGGGFGEPLVYPGGGDLRSGLTVDLDVDGHIDVVTINGDANTVSVLFGNGDGTLAAPVTFAVGTSPRVVRSADFDLDGLPDLITSNSASGDLTLLLSAGTAGPTTTLTMPAAPNVTGLEVADFDTDGLIDLAASSTIENVVLIFRAIGPGTFAPPEAIASTADPADLVASDFDGDGNVDLAGTRPSPSDNLWLLWGNGDATFTVTLGPDLPGAGRAHAADCDRDGVDDLLISTTFDGALRYVRGNPSRTLLVDDSMFHLTDTENAVAIDGDPHGPRTLFIGGDLGCYRMEISDRFQQAEVRFDATDFAGAGSGEVGVGDFNGDGTHDLAVAENDSLQLYFVVDGTFVEGPSFPIVGIGSGLTVLDFDGDGDDDLLLRSSDFTTQVNHLSIFRSGELSPFSQIELPAAGLTIVVDDFTNDGIADVIVDLWSSGQFDFALYAGDGNGGLEASTSVALPSGLLDGASGDFDGDGQIDLAFSSVSEVWVFPGVAPSDFGPPALVHSTPMRGLDAADIDGDGDLDLVGATADDELVVMLNSDGVFQSVVHPVLPPASGTAGQGLADVNGDGHLDYMVIQNGVRDAFLVSRGDGQGGFATAEIFPLRTDSFFLGSVTATPSDSHPGVDVWVPTSNSTLVAPGWQIYRLRNLGAARDCNGNGVLDGCDAALGSLDCESVFIRGDANQDLAFDVADAIRILNLLFGTDVVACEVAVDVNDDESIDISDAIFALSHLFAAGPPPSEPYPECGVGVDVALGCDAPACP